MARIGTGEVHAGVLFWKPEEKRPLGRSTSKCEDNIKIYLKEVSSGDVEWTDMAQDMDKWRSLVKVVMTD